MPDTDLAIRPQTKPKVERPKLYKVILVNDDYTPFELVVHVLTAVFKTGQEKAIQIMMTAHQKGSCVVAVFSRDIAETKVQEATDLAKSQEAALQFTIEPEE
jgi:ATP-dependent Clp protease adaptor protein ClpS